MKQLLIDSDVVLDFFFDRKPFSVDATRIFSMCESKTAHGFVTPVIISNTYYLLRRTAKHEKVIENLKLLVSITDLLMMDKEVVIQALRSDFKDFEDALQNFAAHVDGRIDVIITRNVKDYKKSRISVMTPETFVKSFNG